MEIIQIKITSIPEGEAPKEIREKWVGLKLVGVAYKPGIIDLILRENPSGCIVLIDMALKALVHRDEEAFKWWLNWKIKHPNSDVFLFDKGCYEVLDPTQENQAFLDAFKGRPLEELVDYIMQN